MTPDLEHLQDHLQLITTSIELRVRAFESDTASRQQAIECLDTSSSRITQRREADASLTASLLERRLSLSPTELTVVWSLAALALSTEARVLFAHATGEKEGDPTLRGIKQLVYGEAPSRTALRELAETGTLRRFGIVERTDVDQHESKQTWALSPRVLALLHGDRSCSTHVLRLSKRRLERRSVEELVAEPMVIAALQRALHSRVANVVVSGASGLGRRTVIASVAGELGISIVEVDAERLASKDHEELRRQLRAVALECKLLECSPLIANIDALEEERLQLLDSQLVEPLDGLVLATARPGGPSVRWSRPTIAIEMTKPSSEQLEQLWQQQLTGSSVAVADLVARYPIAPALVNDAMTAARACAVSTDVQMDDIRCGLRTVLDSKLGDLARRLAVTQTWNDIVLPSDQLSSIAELIARVRYRQRVHEQWGFAAKVGKGLGVSALFSGPPGTGKTMLAGLIARDLGLELYQVDLGRVVSKWIGETEKNLGALFDAAEAGHAILLFDEADALFGKRTDVKSSNDRHANMETNYLLQRLESFTGICLLTSNHEAHIDGAFQRRLSLHLRLELPDVDEREMLWRAVLPAAAPVASDLDLEALAERFAMSGGYIRNAAMRAAFVAAAKNIPITTALLEHAARREYEGMGKLA